MEDRTGALSEIVYLEELFSSFSMSSSAIITIKCADIAAEVAEDQTETDATTT